MRDNFSQPTINTLSKRVGNRCSNPNCRQVTTGPHSDIDKHINVGVASHITAASPNGFRYDPNLTREERSSIDNGIWLGQGCSKLIDSDVKRYSVEVLKEWRKLSESAALYEIENRELDKTKDDIEILQFYIQCFNRPAFQDFFSQESSTEAFDQALEDTMIALNTGTLKDRSGNVLSQSKGISYLKNSKWRDQMSVIVQFLRTMRDRYKLAKKQGQIKTTARNSDYYDIVDRELYNWFDQSRTEMLMIFDRLCAEAGIHCATNGLKRRKR